MDFLSNMFVPAKKANKKAKQELDLADVFGEDVDLSEQASFSLRLSEDKAISALKQIEASHPNIDFSKTPCTADRYCCLLRVVPHTYTIFAENG
jgi:hypothetical protein